MKSIKPGRGPSMMGGIMSIAAAIFGVFWTITTLRMGVIFFSLFGVFFVVMAIVQAVYNFKNATGENRYSAYDITDEFEEVDPLNQRFGGQQQSVNQHRQEVSDMDNNFCPYCGAKLNGDFEFCNKCGKKLPR